ncbi:hypothetical protein, partial [Alistipes putredinis]|uniref:hypothetical protein n=1 Tax=Alistipes putredinis TaxID=28117 RepID=UPI003AB720D7
GPDNSIAVAMGLQSGTITGTGSSGDTSTPSSYQQYLLLIIQHHRHQQHQQIFVFFLFYGLLRHELRNVSEPAKENPATYRMRGFLFSNP